MRNIKITLAIVLSLYAAVLTLHTVQWQQAYIVVNLQRKTYHVHHNWDAYRERTDRLKSLLESLNIQGRKHLPQPWKWPDMADGTDLRTDILCVQLRVVMREELDSAMHTLPSGDWCNFTLSTDENKQGKHTGKRAWRNNL